MKYKDNVTELLLRFDDEDELLYHIDWSSGWSFIVGAIGCEFVEVMGRAL